VVVAAEQEVREATLQGQMLLEMVERQLLTLELLMQVVVAVGKRKIQAVQVVLVVVEQVTVLFAQLQQRLLRELLIVVAAVVVKVE
jgi:hypothetical protein